jgi:hypothetical protein
MFSWLKYLNSFISRSVLRQNMEWSKGVIFLMATFWPEGLWSAELPLHQRLFSDRGQWCAHHTTPYAPSPTTSWMSYCSETLKDIFLELPLPAGGMFAGYGRPGAGARFEEARRGAAECVERGSVRGGVDANSEMSRVLNSAGVSVSESRGRTGWLDIRGVFCVGRRLWHKSW